MLQHLNIKIDCSFKKNNLAEKPYEDFLQIDEENKIFIICDGVTRPKLNDIYPNPSPAAEIANLFAIECLKEIIKFSNNAKNNTEDSLINSFKIANKKILAVNKHLNNFPPGTVALALVIKNNTATYCYIGDCIGIFYSEDKFEKFTKSQTKLINTNKAQFTTEQIRQEICNNFYHPFGYGVLNGNPNAELFLKSGTFILKKGSSILMSSDGIECLLNSKGEKFIQSMTAIDIIHEAEKLEVNEHIRSDDKTVVKIIIS